MIKKFNEFIEEDKIIDVQPSQTQNTTKYDGTKIIDNMMFWLRNYQDNTIVKTYDELKNVKIVLNNDKVISVSTNLDYFLNNTKIDKQQFLSFYSNSSRIDNFKMDINNDIITFSEFKINEEKE